ncbi:helix-turn-helix transcriptional regulator [Salipaludibacillus sp. CF4.18]|uniref:helix-turn-helix transcriptional regulator n=1 Tax=Salipaludibacillus sp. CF4.18 TaxID=3373081 RepID=UPI003EE786A9
MNRLTQKDLFSLVIFQHLSAQEDYPANMVSSLEKKITHRPINRRHFYTTVTQLEKQSLIRLSHVEGKRIYYALTENGHQAYTHYTDSLQPSMSALKQTNDRLLRVMLNKSLHPYPAVPLKITYRSFFSRIFSVKDIIRYYTLKSLLKTKRVYIAEMKDLIENDLGWGATEGYFYDIAHEMESNYLITGQWLDDRRTKKYYQITDDGAYHFKEIEQSLMESSKQNNHYLTECLHLLTNNK